jgi:hypothetical protein
MKAAITILLLSFCLLNIGNAETSVLTDEEGFVTITITGQPISNITEIEKETCILLTPDGDVYDYESETLYPSQDNFNTEETT